MVYFDNKYLAQWLEQEVPLQVYINHQYYDIADMSDLENPIVGYGYDYNGQPYTINYRLIQQIKIGANIIDLEALQGERAGEEAPDDDDAPEGEQSPDGDEEEPDAGDAFTPSTPPNAGPDTFPEPEIQSAPAD